MRMVWALMIWIVFIGGLLFFVRHREGVSEREAVVFEPQRAAGSYVLTVTTTFAAEPDPFALAGESENPPAALIVRMGPRTLLRATERLEAGVPVAVPMNDAIVQGTNEIYLEAYPPLADGRSRAVRIQLAKDGLPVAEWTFWSELGGTIAETLRFEIGRDGEEHGHAHP